MVRSVVALGSNIGDRLATLNGAVERLLELGTLESLSALYETAPMGGPEQPAFYNAVAVLDTDLAAGDLLAALHLIEADFDRVRDVRWGPRTLDLDLILHGDDVVASDSLVVPHPRYRSRRFVLEPLLDAWPEARDPDGTALAAIVGEVSDQELEQLRGLGWVGDPLPGSVLAGRGGVWVVGQLALLALFLAVVIIWDDQLPWTWLEVIGGAVASLGVVQMIASFSPLGRQATPYPEPAVGGRLVGRGIYGLARHPMYGAVLMIALGLALIFRSAAAVIVWPLLAWFFVVKTGHEERRLVAAYPGYVRYRERVRNRFVPWLV